MDIKEKIGERLLSGEDWDEILADLQAPPGQNAGKEPRTLHSIIGETAIVNLLPTILSTYMEDLFEAYEKIPDPETEELIFDWILLYDQRVTKSKKERDLMELLNECPNNKIIQAVSNHKDELPARLFEHFKDEVRKAFFKPKAFFDALENLRRLSGQIGIYRGLRLCSNFWRIPPSDTFKQTAKRLWRFIGQTGPFPHAVKKGSLVHPEHIDFRKCVDEFIDKCQSSTDSYNTTTSFSPLREVVQRELEALFGVFHRDFLKPTEAGYRVLQFRANTYSYSDICRKINWEKEQTNFDEVRFVADSLFVVDADLVGLHSKNVSIIAPEVLIEKSASELKIENINARLANTDVIVRVEILVPETSIQKVVWDLSGKDATCNHESKASNGSQEDGQDKNGNNGEDGVAGDNGGSISIATNIIRNSENWTILVNGGKGSDGQAGGDGAVGEVVEPISFKKAFPKWKRYLRRTQTAVRRLPLLPAKNIVINKICDDEDKGERHIFIRTKHHGTAYFLEVYRGKQARGAGRGGSNGVGGVGGKAGRFNASKFNGRDLLDHNLKIEAEPGLRGKDGTVGANGMPAVNGNDLAIAFKGRVYNNFGTRTEIKKIILKRDSVRDGFFCHIPRQFWDSEELSEFYQGQGSYLQVELDGALEQPQLLEVAQKTEQLGQALAKEEKSIDQEEILRRCEEISASAEFDVIAERSTAIIRMVTHRLPPKLQRQRKETSKKPELHYAVLGAENGGKFNEEKDPEESSLSISQSHSVAQQATVPEKTIYQKQYVSRLKQLTLDTSVTDSEDINIDAEREYRDCYRFLIKKSTKDGKQQDYSLSSRDTQIAVVKKLQMWKLSSQELKIVEAVWPSLCSLRSTQDFFSQKWFSMIVKFISNYENRPSEIEKCKKPDSYHLNECFSNENYNWLKAWKTIEKEAQKCALYCKYTKKRDANYSSLKAKFMNEVENFNCCCAYWFFMNCMLANSISAQLHTVQPSSIGRLLYAFSRNINLRVYINGRLFIVQIFCKLVMLNFRSKQ